MLSFASVEEICTRKISCRAPLPLLLNDLEDALEVEAAAVLLCRLLTSSSVVSSLCFATGLFLKTLMLTLPVSTALFATALKRRCRLFGFSGGGSAVDSDVGIETSAAFVTC
jgi:hypothetical protein